jgi:Ca2+-binding RTX toxin-like protein
MTRAADHRRGTSRHRIKRLARAERATDLSEPVNLELLEPRRHLSVGLSRGGTLYATGASGNDTIIVVRDTHKARRIDVIENGVFARFAVKSVRRIALSGGAGNDTISVNDSAGIIAPQNILLDGGDGADRLNDGVSGATLLGGNGNDTIVGGSGADYILAGSGDDACWGGAGDDQIYGEGGNDQLFGQNGNDTLGGNGEDRLLFMGDNGNPDHLANYPAAELGSDLLNGGKGNDELLNGTWSDTQHYDGTFDRPGNSTLLGGAGSDILNARGPDAADPIQMLSDQDSSDLLPISSYTNAPNKPEAIHVHIFLSIFINGKQVALPTGIGNFGIAVIHTHPSEFNVVHFHDVNPHQFYLKEAFAVWGISFDGTHIGRYRIGDGHTLTMEVQRQGRGKFVPNTQFGDYAIQSTTESKGDRRDVINIRYS